MPVRFADMLRVARDVGEHEIFGRRPCEIKDHGSSNSPPPSLTEVPPLRHHFVEFTAETAQELMDVDEGALHAALNDAL